MIGSTMCMLVASCSRSLASCVAPQMLASVEYAFSVLVAVGQVAREQPLGELLAAAQLVHEVVVEPRLVDAQRRVGEQAVAVEALDVVALVGRAVAPDRDAVLLHRAHEQRARDGAAERRRVEVRAAARADVERAALQRREALVHELAAAVDEARELGAVDLRALGDVGEVGLVVLAEVGRVRARDAAALAHPGDRRGGVQAAREGDADPLADGHAIEHSGHRAGTLRSVDG